MIEQLDGIRETVAHPENLNMCLYINDQPEDYPMHWHTDLEIIMPIENIYTVVVNQRKYELNPGDIILIPSGEIHELYAPKSGRRIIMLCDNSVLNSLRGIDSLQNGFYPCILIRSEKENPIYSILSSLIRQIMEEYKKQEPLYEVLINSLFMNFLVTVCRNCINYTNPALGEQKQKQHRYIEKFLTVCKYINDHCTEDITVNELATLAGYSRYHFARLFYDFSGISYFDYIMKRRIMYAENLLCNPNLSVVDIAMKSGFNSLATFNRNFKSVKKCTPSEYRRMYRCQLYQ